MDAWQYLPPTPRAFSTPTSATIQARRWRAATCARRRGITRFRVPLRPALGTGIIVGLARWVLQRIGLAADDSEISHRGLLRIVGSIPCLSEGALFTSAVKKRLGKETGETHVMTQ